MSNLRIVNIGKLYEIRKFAMDKGLSINDFISYVLWRFKNKITKENYEKVFIFEDGKYKTLVKELKDEI